MSIPENSTTKYFSEVAEIANRIDASAVDQIIDGLLELRNRKGRLFLLGVGGSAANCSHAVNDFRKICGIEAYTPTDNVAELTARANDEGWGTIFIEWLKVSNFNSNDAILVLSVGGGDLKNNISTNIVYALQEAKKRNIKIYGIVGRQGGFTKEVADVTVLIPTVSPDRITPHSEAFQAVIWHGIVSNPKLQLRETKWEGTLKAL